jgi:tetratricopeptide (TPR) repeat protein
LNNGKLTYHPRPAVLHFLVGLMLVFIPAIVSSQRDTIKMDSLLAGKTIAEQVDVLNELSVHHRDFDPYAAITYSKKAAELSALSGDDPKYALSLKNLGIVYYFVSNYDSAMMFYNEALEIFRQLNDSIEISNMMNNMALIHSIRADYDQATDLLEQSYAIAKANHDTNYMMIRLSNLSNIYFYKGDYVAALSHLNEALVLNEFAGQEDMAVDMLISRGSIYEMQDMFVEALNSYEASLEIARKLNNKSRQAIILGNIGLIYIHNNQNKALENITESYLIKERLGDLNGMAFSLSRIGKIYEMQGNPQRANEIYIQSLQISQELGNMREVATALNFIGYNLLLQHDVLSAIEYFIKSLEITSQSQMKLETARNYKNLALAFSALHQYDSATFYLESYTNLKHELQLGSDDIELLESYDQQTADTTDRVVVAGFDQKNEDLRHAITTTWIISIVIIAGLVVFIYLLFGMLISRRKERKKFYRNKNI